MIPFVNRMHLTDDLFISDEQLINFSHEEFNVLFRGQIEDVKTETRVININFKSVGVSLNANIKIETSIEDERLVLSTPINSRRNHWSYA